jgi:hypothetical protein
MGIDGWEDIGVRACHIHRFLKYRVGQLSNEINFLLVVHAILQSANMDSL